MEIKNLHVSVNGKEILKGINAIFEANKTYAIIGPNGNGKSTLLSTIMGDPNFTITSGEILFNGLVINEHSVDERALLGIFLGMQNPPEIEGVGNLDLIKSSLEKQDNKQVSMLDVYSGALLNSKSLRINEENLERNINVGFSGGEKKKNEMLHMTMLKPLFSFLDEIDSGLDVDSISAIGKTINEFKSDQRSVVLVSHYKSLFEIVKPEIVYIVENGLVSKTGDIDLLMKTLNEGFDAK